MRKQQKCFWNIRHYHQLVKKHGWCGIVWIIFFSLKVGKKSGVKTRWIFAMLDYRRRTSQISMGLFE
jgi:hypothetical protein